MISQSLEDAMDHENEMCSYMHYIFNVEALLDGLDIIDRNFIPHVVRFHLG